MALRPTTALRSESLTIRIKPGERGLIDRAAKAANKSRTDFVLDAARKAAEETLLDQTFMIVSPEAFAEFVRIFDAPGKPNANLMRTLSAPLPWK